MSREMRVFIAFVVALLADALQLGTTLVTLGADQGAIPVQLVFSAIVSLALAGLLGPDKRLLPAALIEFLPFVNVAPSFTVAVWVVTRSRKRRGEIGDGD